MTDPPGLKLDERRAAEEGPEDCRSPRLLAEQNRHQPRHPEIEPYQPEGRQDDTFQCLRVGPVDEDAEEADEHRVRNVDQPGPMHGTAEGRVEPPSCHVEPRLTGDPGADFDETHRIVGIAKSPAPDEADQRREEQERHPGRGRHREAQSPRQRTTEHATPLGLHYRQGLSYDRL